MIKGSEGGCGLGRLRSFRSPPAGTRTIGPVLALPGLQDRLADVVAVEPAVLRVCDGDIAKPVGPKLSFAGDGVCDRVCLDSLRGLVEWACTLLPDLAVDDGQRVRRRRRRLMDGLDEIERIVEQFVEDSLVLGLFLISLHVFVCGVSAINCRASVVAEPI